MLHSGVSKLFYSKVASDTLLAGKKCINSLESRMNIFVKQKREKKFLVLVGTLKKKKKYTYLNIKFHNLQFHNYSKNNFSLV